MGDLARKSDPCTMSRMDLVEEVSLVCIWAQTSMPVVQPSMVGVGTEGQTVQTRPAVRRKAPPETPQHPVGHVRFPKNQKWVQASCLPQVSVVFPLTQSVVVPTAKTLARLKTTFYSSGLPVMAEWRQTRFDNFFLGIFKNKKPVIHPGGESIFSVKFLMRPLALARYVETYVVQDFQKKGGTAHTVCFF